MMNLADHFLIAMPSLDDPFFGGSVVYVCQHSEEGAMGVVINKPSPVLMDLIFEAAASPTPERFKGQWVMMGRCKWTEGSWCIRHWVRGKTVWR